MGRYHKSDILSMMEKEDVEFIRLQFTDIQGRLKNMAMTVSQLDNILDGKCKFDCAAVEGYRSTGYEELYLIPDLDTFAIFPWRPQSSKVARFICNVVKPDGTPFEGDSRYVLQKMLRKAEAMGYDFYAGHRTEFFLFDLDEEGKPTVTSRERGGYFDVGPADGGENARRDMVLYSEDMDIGIVSSYHSSEHAHHTIEMEEEDALTMADHIMTERLIIRTVAERHGLHATFMPKPLQQVAGSGAQYRFYLKKNRENIFQGDATSEELPTEGGSFLAGLLQHIDGMFPVTNPVVNSYKRLVPGFFAPVNIGWSRSDAGSLIRLSTNTDGKDCLILRSPDGTSNPYLTLAVILAAGLDGIEQKAQPPAAVELMEEESLRQTKEVPKTLFDALTAFQSDDFMKSVLGGHIWHQIVQTGNYAWDEYCKQVSAWELSHYL